MNVYVVVLHSYLLDLSYGVQRCLMTVNDRKWLCFYDIHLHSGTVSGKVQIYKLCLSHVSWNWCFLFVFIFSLFNLFKFNVLHKIVFSFIILLSKLYFIFLYVGILCAIRRCLSRSSFRCEMHELFRPVVQQVIGHLSDLIELFLNIFGGRLTANSKLTDIIVLKKNKNRSAWSVC